MSTGTTVDALRLDIGADGVAVATMDAPGSGNALGEALLAPLAALAERLGADATLRGLVLASAQADYCVGGEVDTLEDVDAAQAFAASRRVHAVLRALERAGKPVAAAIDGDALGAGLELALACHHRVLRARPGLVLGLPQVRRARQPGAGATARLPRLIGQEAALMLMIGGAPVSPEQALALGLVHELVPEGGPLLERARAWCLAHPQAAQAWDAPGFRFPGGDSRTPQAATRFSLAPSRVAASGGDHVPAAMRILSSVYEGGLLDAERAGEVESRWYAAGFRDG